MTNLKNFLMLMGGIFIILLILIIVASISVSLKSGRQICWYEGTEKVRYEFCIVHNEPFFVIEEDGND